MTFEPLQQFYEEHTVWIGGAAGLSIFLLIGSLLMAPWLLSRLPADYFQNPHHQPLESLVHLPLIRWPLIMLKNLLGLLLLLAGFSMLFLPGQGLLTIVMALVLIDFPGKFRIKRVIIEHPRVGKWINRIRERCGKPHFT